MARPRRSSNGGPPAVPEPDRLPWERQKGEPASGFALFALYRDLGPHRSISKLSLDVKRPGFERLKKRSAEWGWVERAEAYDDHLDARLREERETERIRLERAQLGLGSSIVSLALRRLQGAPPGVDGQGNPVEEVVRLDPNTMDASDVVRAAEIGVRIQRIAAGLPTDLIRGSTAVAGHEVLRMATDLVEIAAQFIPEERQPRFYAELQAYIEAGRRL